MPTNFLTDLRLKDLEPPVLQVDEFGLCYRTVTGHVVYIDGLKEVDENIICTYSHWT